MKSIVATAAIVLSAAVLAKPASAQESKGSGAATTAGAFTVDKAKVKDGKNVWNGAGCMGCHTIGKGRLAAPDLNGLFERRTADWVKSWLKDPPAMTASDPVAKQLLAEYKIQMPKMNLSDVQIDAVMNYIASENKPGKK